MPFGIRCVVFEQVIGPDRDRDFVALIDFDDGEAFDLHHSNTLLSYVAKQSLFYGCLLPGSHRFLQSSFYRSELVAKKVTVSYPKIICVLVDIQGIGLTEHIH